MERRGRRFLFAAGFVAVVALSLLLSDRSVPGGGALEPPGISDETAGDGSRRAAVLAQESFAVGNDPTPNSQGTAGSTSPSSEFEQPTPPVSPDRGEGGFSSQAMSSPRLNDGRPAEEREPSCIDPAGRLPTGGMELDSFGSALAGDAGRLVIGDSRIGSSWPRPVRIYALREERWSLERALEPEHVLQGRFRFGQAVAISSDRVAVSMEANDFTGTFHEVALHILADNGQWALESVLRSDGPVPQAERFDDEPRAFSIKKRHDQFAFQLALEGSLLVAVGTQVSLYGIGVGVRIFELGGRGWELSAAFDPLDGGYRYGGVDVARGRVVVGAVAKTRSRDGYAGGVFVYDRRDGEWGERRRWLQLASADLGRFGASVAWTPDGLAVGSPPRELHGVGAVYLFAGDGDDWDPIEVLRGDEHSRGFGVGLAAEGEVLAVGTPYLDLGGAVVYRSRYGRMQECGRWEGTGPAKGAGTNLVLESGWLVIGSHLPECRQCDPSSHRCRYGSAKTNLLGHEPLPGPPLLDPGRGPIAPLLLRVE